jgi:uncharacterized protein (TIGR03435 family)
MLQNLLALRFGMRVHWDTQQKGGYALVKGNKNLKLTRSVSDPEDATNRRKSISIGTSGGRDFSKRRPILANHQKVDRQFPHFPVESQLKAIGQ